MSLRAPHDQHLTIEQQFCQLTSWTISKLIKYFWFHSISFPWISMVVYLIKLSQSSKVIFYDVWFVASLAVDSHKEKWYFRQDRLEVFIWNNKILIHVEQNHFCLDRHIKTAWVLHHLFYVRYTTFIFKTNVIVLWVAIPYFEPLFFEFIANTNTTIGVFIKKEMHYFFNLVGLALLVHFFLIG